MTTTLEIAATAKACQLIKGKYAFLVPLLFPATLNFSNTVCSIGYVDQSKVFPGLTLHGPHQNNALQPPVPNPFLQPNCAGFIALC